MIRGLYKPDTVMTLDHWKIRYAYDGDTEELAGPTLRETVDAALADLNRRASG